MNHSPERSRPPETGDPFETSDTTQDEEISATDLPTEEEQPETQGADPVIAELGDEGQGDIAVNDL